MITESRHIHLRGATGTIRTATYRGTDHLVVPITALMEGVLHAVNADAPEFVPVAAMAVAPHGWNGRPAVHGHPARDGKQISANDPLVLEAAALGQMFNARLDGTTLKMEAWVEPERVKRISGEAAWRRLEAGEPIEVSVGAFVTTEKRAGVHNGKPYAAVWKEIVPDHVAFLFDGVGACSLAMGCGAYRAASAAPEVYDVTDAGLVVAAYVESQHPRQKDGKWTDSGGSGTAFVDNPESTAVIQQTPKAAQPSAAQAEKLAAAMNTLIKAYSDPEIGLALWGILSSATPESLVQLRDDLVAGYPVDVWGGTGRAKHGKREDWNPPQLTPTTFAANASSRAAVIAAVRTLIDLVQDPAAGATLIAQIRAQTRAHRPSLTAMATAIDAETATLTTAAGARHSRSDLSLIQTLHDHAVALGATCAAHADTKWTALHTHESGDLVETPVTGAKNAATVAPPVRPLSSSDVTPQLKAACACQEGLPMNARVTALIAHPHGGWTEADAPMLEAAPEARLSAFEHAAEAAKAKAEADLKAAEAAKAAELKAAADKQALDDAIAAKLRTNKRLTKDEWFAMAPEGMLTEWSAMRTLAEKAQAADEAKKATIIATLVAAQSEFTADDLAAQSLEQVERFARMLKVNEPEVADYSGRALPRAAAAASEDVYANPPNPWASVLTKKDAPVN